MLSLTQRKLLKLLALNSRFTNKDLAKSLKVSSDTVEYQLKILFEKQKLGHLSALFNYHFLGYTDYHYLIRLKDISKIPIDALVVLPQIIFINTCFGSYDLQVIFLAKTEEEACRYFNEINVILGDLVIDKLIFTSNHVYKYSSIIPELDVEVTIPKNKKQFVYAATTNSYAFRSSKYVELDALDFRLIHYLINNSRETYLKMSQDLGVSRELVRRRIERYIKNQVLIAFAFKPYYDKFDYYSNFILLKFSNVDQSEIQNYVDSVPEIFYAGRTIGVFSAIVYVVTKTPADFARIVKDLKIRFKEKLLDTQLFYFDKIFKQTQFPGIEILKYLK